MTKLFLDTNVILDIVLGRDGAEDACRIMELASRDKDVRLFCSYLTMANLAYVMRKLPGPELKGLVSEIIERCTVLSQGDMQLYLSLKNDCPDFEDALQISCAEVNGCTCILTNNARHFRKFTEIAVLSPSDFQSYLK